MPSAAPPRPLSLLLQEHRYPHSRRPADTHGDVQRAEQRCLATQLGWAGQEGVETELRQRLGRSNFSSPLGPRREASHLSLLQPTEQDSTCPRRDQYRLRLAWDPQPIAAAFTASGWAFVTCGHCQQPCPSPNHRLTVHSTLVSLADPCPPHHAPAPLCQAPGDTRLSTEPSLLARPLLRCPELLPASDTQEEQNLNRDSGRISLRIHRPTRGCGQGLPAGCEGAGGWLVVESITIQSQYACRSFGTYSLLGCCCPEARPGPRELTLQGVCGWG